MPGKNGPDSSPAEHILNRTNGIQCIAITCPVVPLFAFFVFRFPRYSSSIPMADHTLLTLLLKCQERIISFFAHFMLLANREQEPGLSLYHFTLDNVGLYLRCVPRY